MPEIKHAFSQGKMNKDLDERLVPNGQYRHAMNVQVSTSDGSDMGTLQNILGNTNLSQIDEFGMFCAGSIADEKNDTIYWLIGNEFAPTPSFTQTGGGLLVDEKLGRSMIMQFKAPNTVTPVLVDHDKVVTGHYSYTHDIPNREYSITLPSNSTVIGSIRPGMKARVTNGTTQISYNYQNIVKDVDYSAKKVYFTLPFNSDTAFFIALSHGDTIAWMFQDPKDSILGFKKDKPVTGINIIPASEEENDDLLFWTDNNSEPKKINIKRCIEGTDPNGLVHTRLIIDGEDVGPLKEQHVTVIRRKPVNRPELEMYNTKREGTVTGTTTINMANNYVGSGSFLLQINNMDGNSMPFNLHPQDTLWLQTPASSIGVGFPLSNFDYKVKIEEVHSNDPSNNYAEFYVNLIDKDANAPSDDELEDYNVEYHEFDRSLYEFKFPRFAFRYKYSDDEYSGIGPFSDIAFIPGNFDYHPRKGHNLGMINQLRKLYIKNIVPNDIPKDVQEVDILYKESNSPTVYVVDTIRKNDQKVTGESINQWNNVNKTNVSYSGESNFPWPTGNSGKYEIKAETIHAILPENQMLRPWDNVPRKALAQEIVGNRLIYANYLQNYNLKIEQEEIINGVPTYIEKDFIPEFEVNYSQYSYTDIHGEHRDRPVAAQPGQSLKSMRDYQIGIVYTDKYGRETPVLTSTSGTISMPKEEATNYNQFDIKLKGSPPEWVDSYKFYIKEPSNEYYNIAQAGIYDAEDGCAWVSFPSSDRNKVDIDTYLLLKKGPESDTQLTKDNRYKILAIENEAPEFIKSYKLRRGRVRHFRRELWGDNAVTPNNGYGVFSPLDEMPVPGAFSFQLSKNVIGKRGLGQMHEIFHDSSNIGTRKWFVQFSLDNISTDYIEVTGVELFPDAPDGSDEHDNNWTGKFEITTAKMLTEEVAFIFDADLNDGEGGIKDDTVMSFWEERVEHRPEFDGRFFVKVISDDVLESEFSVVKQQEYGVVASEKIYHFNWKVWQLRADNNTTQHNGLGYTHPELGKRFSFLGLAGSWWDPRPVMKRNAGENYVNCWHTEKYGAEAQFIGANARGGSYEHQNPGSLNFAIAGGTSFTNGQGFFNPQAGLDLNHEKGCDRRYKTQQEIWSMFLVGYHGQEWSYNGYGEPMLDNLPGRDRVNANGLVWESIGRTLGHPEDATWFIDGFDNSGQNTGLKSNNNTYSAGRLWDPTSAMGPYSEKSEAPGHGDHLVYHRRFGGVDTRDNAYQSWGIKSFSREHHMDLCFGGYHGIGPDGDNTEFDTLEASGGGIPLLDEKKALTIQPNYESAHLNINKGPYANQGKFIKGLEPGNKFRWKEDPTQTVYTVLEVHEDVFFNYADRDTQGSLTYKYGSKFRYRSGYWNAWAKFPQNRRKRFRLVIDKPLSWNPINDQSNGLIPGGLEVRLTTGIGTHDGYNPVSPSRTNVGTPVTIGGYINGEIGYPKSVIELTSIEDNDGNTLKPGMSLTAASSSTVLKYDTWDVNVGGSYHVTDVAWPVVEEIRKYEDPTTGTITYDVILGHNGWLSKGQGGMGGWYGKNMNIGPGETLTFKQTIMNGFSKNTDSWRQADRNFFTQPYLRGNWPAQENNMGLPKSIGYTLEVLRPIYSEAILPENPAIWETEPKDDVDLDIYHEIGQAYPMNINPEYSDIRHDQHTIPIGSSVTVVPNQLNGSLSTLDNVWEYDAGAVYEIDETEGFDKIIFPSNDYMVELIGATVIGNEMVESGTIVIDIDNTGADGVITLNKNLLAGGSLTGESFTFQKEETPFVSEVDGNSIKIENVNFNGGLLLQAINPQNSDKPDILQFQKGKNWIEFTCMGTGPFNPSNIVNDPVSNSGYAWVKVDSTTYNNRRSLDWSNCISFGNGVESNRIGDSFNAVTIDKGPRVSTTLAEKYKEERRSSGLIYSGIYNTNSGVNNLNQFIQAENITKDLNPQYGTIQKLHARNTDLIALCEDKILNILANKDAVFNADGNTQLTATQKVLGQAVPYTGEYGISKDPTSFCSEAFRAYFTDRNRGAVLRLSRDGITNISEYGMKNWFKDNLPNADQVVGTYDQNKGEYNVTLYNETNLEYSNTVSYNERVNGWVSFKSFIPEDGLSLSNEYYTFYLGNLYKHHVNQNRNTFYYNVLQNNAFTPSTVDVLFNDNPSNVKAFQTLNYEGSRAKITKDTTDNQYYNLDNKTGWYLNWVVTDKQDGTLREFIEKEGRFYGHISGVTTSISNLDTREFSVQGISSGFEFGELDSGTPTPIFGCTDSSATNYNAAATQDDGSCIYPPIYGCMDSNATNFNSNATADDGSCVYPVYGCTNQYAQNYNPSATHDDGSCIMHVMGCTDPSANNFNSNATMNDGTCTYDIPGCTDSNASNYNSNATIDDGSCVYPPPTYDLVIKFISDIEQQDYPLYFDHSGNYNFLVNPNLNTGYEEDLIVSGVIQSGQGWVGSVTFDIYPGITYGRIQETQQFPLGKMSDNLMLPSLRIFGMMPDLSPGQGITGSGSPVYESFFNSLPGMPGYGGLNKAGTFVEIPAPPNSNVNLPSGYFSDYDPNYTSLPGTYVSGHNHPTTDWFLTKAVNYITDPYKYQAYYATDPNITSGGPVNGYNVDIGDITAVESGQITGSVMPAKITVNIDIELSQSTPFSPNQDLIIYIPINQDIGIWNTQNYA